MAGHDQIHGGEWNDGNRRDSGTDQKELKATERPQFRRYEPADADAVWELHDRALRDAGTDPADVPGTEDLRRIEAAYLDVGGEFLIGVVPATEDENVNGNPRDDPGAEAEDDGASPERRTHRRPSRARELRTDDGLLVAMGGFVPREASDAGKRTLAGAAELHRMRVAPAVQRRGYGRELLERVERRAADSGFDRLLATTARNQSAAVAFYPAAGYERVGESTDSGYRLLHFEKRL